MSLEINTSEENKIYVFKFVNFSQYNMHPLVEFVHNSVLIITPQKHFEIGKDKEKRYYNTFDVEFNETKELDVFNGKVFGYKEMEIIRLTKENSEFEVSNLFKVYKEKDGESEKWILEMKNSGLRTKDCESIVIRDEKMLLAISYENRKYTNADVAWIAPEFYYKEEWRRQRKRVSSINDDIWNLEKILRDYPYENETNEAIQKDLLKMKKSLLKDEVIRDHLLSEYHDNKRKRTIF